MMYRSEREKKEWKPSERDIKKNRKSGKKKHISCLTLCTPPNYSIHPQLRIAFYTPWFA
jgi:hypothetical protein